MRTQTRSAAVLIALMLVGVAIPGEAVDRDDFEIRPGPVLVLMDSGIDEYSFVPRRDAAKAVPALRTANFEVTYIGFSFEAQTAFQAAVDIWSSLISSPVTIRIEAKWTPLPENQLGQAGSSFFSSALLPNPDTFYPEPLVDALVGSDVRPGEFDIEAEFNSDHPGWYLGTDGNTPAGMSDFVTTVLHEIGHGLGFLGSAKVEAGLGSWGDSGKPFIFDRFTQDGTGVAIIDTGVFPNPSAVLASVFQSSNLWWGGSLAVAVNGGVRPRLYAPPTWEPSSSYSHLDEMSYPAGNLNSLMTPLLGGAESIHDPGPITLCLFQDIGWTTSETAVAAVAEEEVVVVAVAVAAVAAPMSTGCRPRFMRPEPRAASGGSM